MDMKTFGRQAFFTLVFTVFLNVFFLQPIGSLFVALWMLSWLSYFGIAFYLANSRPGRNHVSPFGSMVIFCALMIVLRGGGFVQAILFITGILSLFIYVYLSHFNLDRIRNYFELMVSPLLLMWSWLSGFIVFLSQLFSDKLPFIGSNQEGKYAPVVKSVKSAILGLLLGLPVVLILTGLLRSADPIFDKLTSSVFSYSSLTDIIKRIFLTVFFFMAAIPFIVKSKENKLPHINSYLKAYMYRKELSVVIAMVNIVLGVFLFIQWKYLFLQSVTPVDLKRFGLTTYSEYVRRGFAELLLATAIVYCLSWLVNLTRKLKTERDILSLLDPILAVQISIFILSIVRRVILYTQYHGLSLVRIYGLWFLVGLTGLFLTLYLRSLRPKIRWVTVELVFGAVMVIILGTVNFESIIVRVLPPTVNNKTDYVYLSRLSADGVDGWLVSYDAARRELADSRYNHKSYLDPLDRKQIAYAGEILFSLTRRYDEYIFQYAPDRQQIAYLNELLQAEGKRLELLNKKLSAKRDLTVNRQEKDIISKDITENSKKINQAYADGLALARGKVGITVIRRKLRPKYWPSARDSSNFYNMPVESMHFYEYEPEGWKYGYNHEKNIWSWSYAGKTAWEKLNHHITSGERLNDNSLYQAQAQYIRLYEKIYIQGPDNRSYSPDISFDIPLL